MWFIVYSEYISNKNRILKIEQISGKPLEFGILPSVGATIVKDDFSGIVLEVVKDERETSNQFPDKIYASIILKNVKINNKVIK